MKATVQQVYYYVVTKSLARAMREGRDCAKGTVYGVFRTQGAADAHIDALGLKLVATVVAQ